VVGNASLSSGRGGEDAACTYLEGRGFRILDRNVRSRTGELDIVARDGATLVFVEVKRRRSRGHGAAIEAVTRHKRRRIVAAARRYTASRGLSEQPIRFDVIAIDPDGLRHERSAFDASGE
jgi:putative endonuclease